MDFARRMMMGASFSRLREYPRMSHVKRLRWFSLGNAPAFQSAATRALSLAGEISKLM